MNPIDIERPKVTRVKITVQRPSPIEPTCTTHIRISADKALNEDNFDYYPTLIIDNTDAFYLKENEYDRSFDAGDAVFEKEGNPFSDITDPTQIYVAVKSDISDFCYENNCDLFAPQKK
ncbi:MAG: hypothetical protein AAGA77_17440 [Bacteroidota bacterium]